MVSNEYIYDELDKTELGFICIKEDDYIQLLTKNTTFSDGIAIWAHDNKDLKIVHIARVFYNEEPGYISSSLIKTRSDAVHEAFKRWTAAGYNKHKAVDPFKCRAFKKYYESIDYLKSDYIIFDEGMSLKKTQQLGQMSIEDYPEYMPDLNNN